MEVELNGQKKELKELKYLDAIDVEEVRQKEGLRAGSKKMFMYLGLTEEEVNELSLSDGLKIQTDINELTENFRIPAKKDESSTN